MKQEIIKTIRKNLADIIPELVEPDISADTSFTDMGANSIDRSELIMLTLEHFNLNIPRIEFVGANTINQLADLIDSKMQ
jgi:polyketide biosynthesis acyl carrier protein